MAEVRLTRVEQGQTKIRNVPIAVTPEGFWCCPSPVGFQKTLKAQNTLNKPKSSSPPPPPQPSKASVLKKQTHTLTRSVSATDDQRGLSSETVAISTPPVVTERNSRSKVENLPRKVAIEFGEPGTSDMKVVLLGKQGFCVKMSVHRSYLVENSSFFADKLLNRESGFACLEIDDCEDVEIYVETVGLMYCKDMKQRLIKQSVARVLRILKVAELLGFNSCIHSCLGYLEAVPWIGEEEEEKVVSSVLRLQSEGIGITTVNPVLKRVSSNISNPPKETLHHIIKLVLKSNEEKGRREMKSVVLKLLKEHNNLPTGSADICSETIYTSCTSCLDSLLDLFKQAADKPSEIKETLTKQQVAIEADNLSWLLDILADSRAADEFASIWSNQRELSALHEKLPITTRYHVSRVTARLFVGIGRGELLPSKETRHMLLKTWFQPLINDYNWLQHGCRSFDRKVVEEGIGRTILTLPLEDQQSVMIGWLSCFLKTGDNCPNLQRAFEVWWRRTFIRPYVGDPSGHPTRSDNVDAPGNPTRSDNVELLIHRVTQLGQTTTVVQEGTDLGRATTQ